VTQIEGELENRLLIWANRGKGLGSLGPWAVALA